jgi:acyl-coenzyme A synthetase/AMP-(fatty) acid ligase
MKPIAIFVLVAAVALGAVAASAKTGTAPGNTDERVIAQVAGPPAAAKNSKKTAAKAEKAKKEADKAQSRSHQHSP